jgi:predicted nucleic acid-binding protein
VFLKKMRLGSISEPDVNIALASILERLDFRDESGYYELALAIAHAHGRSFYDAVYVALALQEQCPLVSADERLCNALRPHFGETMLWLGDVPAV